MLKRVTLLGLAALAAGPATANGWRVQPEATVEGRVFLSDPAFGGQESGPQGTLILSGTADWRSDDRNWIGKLEPYARIDSLDKERNLFDLREASLTYRGRQTQLSGGIGQFFWGVAESRNVVDVLNQIDATEDVDGAQKLGQPFLRVSQRTDIGTFDAYYLPVFRERDFPGQVDRLRTNPLVNDDARYGRDGEQTAGDFALRYTEQFDAFDLGLSAFHGTSRDPVLRFSGGALTPFYPELNQVGVDAVRVDGAWLFKGELAAGVVGGEGFTAAVAGAEYTLYGVTDGGADLGLIAEWLYDDRDGANQPLTPLDNDLFVGTRFVLNDFSDTELLFGGFYDPDTQGMQASAEFSRRVGDQTLLELEGRLFDAGDDTLIQTLEDDDLMTLRLTRFF
ncbi:MAG: hypothetical protein AAFQ36_13860 [Pseudomonadota bacterium]